jgi:hypothetical protein
VVLGWKWVNGEAFPAEHSSRFLAESAMDLTTEVPGTGQTVGELQALGYDDSDIQSLFSSGDIPTSGLSDTAYGPTAAPDGGNGGNTNWLSGLGDFLGSAGTTITNITRALSSPKPGTTLYNPATGLPYGIDPRTGLPTRPAQTSQFLNVAVWILIAVAVVWTLKKL